MDLNLHKIIKINWITISTNYTKTRICIASKTSSVVNFTWMILKICYLFHWSSVWIVVCHRSQTQYLEYWCQKDMHIYVILPPYHLLHWKIESLRGSVCISEHLRTVGFLGASSGPPDPCRNGEHLRASYLIRDVFRGNPFYALTCLVGCL